MREFKYKLNDQEKILLSRIYKLDKQIETYIKNHKNEDMNKLIPKTDFIKKSNELYKLMNDKIKEIAFENTKYIKNLIVEKEK